MIVEDEAPARRYLGELLHATKRVEVAAAVATVGEANQALAAEFAVDAPDASWGAMAADGRVVYRVHPYQIVIPSVAIATLVMCANFIADGLRDALDPRTRET